MYIRPATISDVNRIVAINVKSWKAGHSAVLCATLLDSLISERSRYEYWMSMLSAKQTNMRTLIAEEAGELLGYVTAGPTSDSDLGALQGPVGEIHSLYVNPSIWGHGVGNSLLNHSIHSLFNQRFLDISLWVTEDSQVAKALYSRIGFQQERLKAENLDGTHLRVNRWRLSSRNC